MNPFSLQGKTIVVTGSRGFLASQFIPFLQALGAVVVGLDIKEEYPVDITNRAAVDERLANLGSIDGVVHGAALDAVPGGDARQFLPYEQFPEDLWQKELSVNLTAAHIVMQAAAPYLMKADKGSVVFIASDLALIAPNNTLYEQGKFKDIAYVTSKAGMMGLMRSWAAYLGSHGVRVNALVPGGMMNGHAELFVQKAGTLNMLGRMAQQGEYNAPLAFLLSDASSYMTGSSLVVDGGRTAI